MTEELHKLGLLGSHPSMIELFNGIKRAARSDQPALIWGSTGCGKELVARAIHTLSARGPRSLLPINVAALPASLVENELFGAVKGAYTDAQRRPGLLEAADGSSLLLDEAGDLPPAIQCKLLRAVELGEVRRLGACHVVRVAVRLLVTVQRDPAELVRLGRWREDFYYRVNTHILPVPPLDAHRSDIPEIATAFLALRHQTTIREPALRLLQRRSWPGNVRQLQQVLSRAASYATGCEITCTEVELALDADGLSRAMPSDQTLAYGRARHVRQVVDACAGDTGEAAGILGISRRHVYRLLKTAGPDGPREIGVQ